MMSVVRSRLATVARGSFSKATFRSVASRDPIVAYSREAPIRSVTSSMNATAPATRYWSSMSLGEVKQFSSSSAKIEGRVREVSRSKRISFPLLYHINYGIEEILKDYVHHEITRTWIVIGLRLFYLIVIKDVFVFLFFSEQSEEPNRSFLEPGTTSKQL